MKLSELLLAQLERESAGTRKALERVPEGKNDWRPHPKSMPLGSLAALVASMPSWFAIIVDQNELDLASGTGAQPAVKTPGELLQIHDKALEAARKSLSKATDDHLMKSWRLLFGGKVLDDRPRHLILADTISHLAHHRAQLTVYLRLNDKPVPALYGASADEGR
ncbi:MAG TPA: damage-inducible protein DinB [Thermoanaerobaculia bacterium]|nr:damage-inducible protein DinB [Thermoanaerobaculia bacterium]